MNTNEERLRKLAKQLYREGKDAEADAVIDAITAEENRSGALAVQDRAQLPSGGLSNEGRALVSEMLSQMGGMITKAVGEAMLPMAEALGSMAAAQRKSAEVQASATLGKRGMTESEWDEQERNAAASHYARPASPLGVGHDGRPNVEDGGGFPRPHPRRR